MTFVDDARTRREISKIMGASPSRINQLILRAAWIDTPLGSMIAIAGDDGLYLLEFVDRRSLENEIKKLVKTLKAVIALGENTIIKSIKNEIVAYFKQKKFIFTTPMHLLGSLFQKKVWEELQRIPLGETRSYLEIAKQIKAPTACRAVARANSTNQLAIIIPCHRVIKTNGELGGYAAGVIRKQWLLEHEKNA
jgi:AraC family transcriptional regulator of adaptative response/methylated-DNA-[protein]-cysteine methyltransferase